MFPFNSVKPSIKINCHGGFEPEKEQLPGSAKTGIVFKNGKCF